MEFVKAKPVQMKDHGGEASLQNIIANDPSVLGMGNLRLVDKEKRLPGGGIVDILLSDPSDETRYSVEVQLGRTDESHIIRTIEYWDLMRKRYPEFSHVAVLVAEEITSRFFNVIALFNQYLPVVAIQVTPVEVEGKLTATFAKVLDLSPQRSETEAEFEPVSRKDWEAYATPETMELVDKIFGIAKEFEPRVQLTFRKSYITVNLGDPRSVGLFMDAQKKQLRLTVKLLESQELNTLCEAQGFEADFSTFWGGYRFAIKPGEFERHSAFFRNLIERVYGKGQIGS